jgi:hypothetical protein
MPTTLTGLLLLVVVLLPGITYVAMRERDSPEKDRSPFRETAAVATVSILANTSALGIFAAIRVTCPAITPDVGRFIRDTEAYFYDSYASLILWGVLILAGAVGIAAGLALLAKRPDPHPSKLSAWWMLFRHYHNRYYPTSTRHVGCFLDDGSWVEGYLASYNTSSDDSPDREIVLVGPIKYAFSGNEHAKPYPGRSVAISARHIRTMFVTYLPAPEEPTSPPETRRASASQEEPTTRAGQGSAQ